ATAAFSDAFAVVTIAAFGCPSSTRTKFLGAANASPFSQAEIASIRIQPVRSDCPEADFISGSCLKPEFVGGLRLPALLSRPQTCREKGPKPAVLFDHLPQRNQGRQRYKLCVCRQVQLGPGF